MWVSDNFPFLSLKLSLLRALFLRKNESFFLENASNFTHDFSYDNFNKKIFLSAKKLKSFA